MTVRPQPQERTMTDARPGTAPEIGSGRASAPAGATEPPESALGDHPEILSPETGVERLRDGLAAWRAAGSPILDPIAKAAANPTSRSLAIAAKCYDCQGQDADPGWRWRIGNCDAPCPLVPVRPYQQLAGTPMPAALAEHAS